MCEKWVSEFSSSSLQMNKPPTLSKQQGSVPFSGPSDVSTVAEEHKDKNWMSPPNASEYVRLNCRS